jgi:hypothetical protein
MDLILEVVSGPDQGRQLRLKPHELRQVGRGMADFILRHDRTMAGVHFDVRCEGNCGRLRHLGGGVTLVNGQKVTASAVVRDGDEITAGVTVLRARLTEGRPSVAPKPVPSAEAGPASPATPAGPGAAGPGQQRAQPGSVLDILREQVEPLFALVDSGRTCRVRQLLAASGEEHESLYEGPEGEAMADFAPYLVRLPAQSSLLEVLVRDGWGKSWGVYLTCPRPFLEVRKHFRRFLLVQTEDRRELYFRFYNPELLRIFLPTCNRDEAATFFGPVNRFLVESEQPGELLQMGVTGTERLVVGGTP